MNGICIVRMEWRSDERSLERYEQCKAGMLVFAQKKSVRTLVPLVGGVNQTSF
jgi:hypothetical protein